MIALSTFLPMVIKLTCLSWRWMPAVSLVRNGPGWTPGSKRHPVAAVRPSPPRFGDAVRLSDPALVSVADRNCTVSAP